MEVFQICAEPVHTVARHAACRATMDVAQGGVPHPVSRQCPPIAHGSLLCYPYVHPGPGALLTTYAPSVGRMTPHTGLHPKRPWGQDRGCLVRETSPSGSTDTRTGPGQDGRVRPPPALGVPVETA